MIMGDYSRKKAFYFPTIFSSFLVKKITVEDDGIHIDNFFIKEFFIRKNTIISIKLKMYHVQTEYFHYTMKIVCISHSRGTIKLNVSGRFSDFEGYKLLLSDLSRLHPIEVNDFRGITKKLDLYLLVALGVIFLVFFT